MMIEFPLQDGERSRWVNLDHVVHVSLVGKTKSWEEKGADGTKSAMTADEVGDMAEVVLLGQNWSGKRNGELVLQQETFTISYSSPSMRKLRLWMWAHKWLPVASGVASVFAVVVSLADRFAYVRVPPCVRLYDCAVFGGLRTAFYDTGWSCRFWLVKCRLRG